MEFWNLIKNNQETFELLRDPVFIFFTLLNFFWNVINSYRSRSKKAVLRLSAFNGELFRFKRGNILRAHMKIDFDLSVENEDIYLAQISILNPTAADISRYQFWGFKRDAYLPIKNIRFYLRNWPSFMESQKEWEYDVLVSAKELPINRVLMDHKMQYRNMAINTERHNSFRDEWGGIDPQEWSCVDGSLLIAKNSKRHVSILCELTFDNFQEAEVDKSFSNCNVTYLDLKIEFNSRKMKKRVALQPADSSKRGLG